MPARSRGADRPAPRQGRRRREDRRPTSSTSSTRLQNDAIGRDRHVEVARRRFDLPSLDRAPDGASRQAAVSRRCRSASARRSKTATTTTSSRSALHPRGPDEDRGGDAPHRRGGPRDRAVARCRWTRRSRSSRTRTTRSKSRSSASSRTESVSPATGRGSSSISAAARTSPRPAGSASSSSRTRRAPTGRATRRTRCSSASTAPAFLTQKELDDHLKQLEDAKARDHRKLGRELDLVTFHPLAPASPFFLPEGRRRLQRADRATCAPSTARAGTTRSSRRRSSTSELFRMSGHYDNYRENMYLHGGRRAGVRRQAHELPGTPPPLPGRASGRTATCPSASRTSAGSTATSARE